MLPRRTSASPKGSSPRMRGALDHHPRVVALEGIIPAYAGSTRARPPRPGGCRDHPRVCGEHARGMMLQAHRTGSSPRMRGALSALGLRGQALGIIPAYAGSTTPRRRRRPWAGDHPRVCGEHSASAVSVSAAQGSSPRMRGAPDQLNATIPMAGIIPAYAGSTTGHSCMFFTCRDHPRVCGEHVRSARESQARRGSSPRMRGALHDLRRHKKQSGIIPAYAGSTCITFGVDAALGDHPRVCGEHEVNYRKVLIPQGSSPRMRGARGLRYEIDSAGGIIPAYAGSTPQNVVLAGLARDHPRVCGEHKAHSPKVNDETGSSPRMRGAPHPLFAPREGAGIIPAYAGSTCLHL